MKQMLLHFNGIPIGIILLLYVIRRVLLRGIQLLDILALYRRKEMGTLPKGYKQENYIEINKPKIYYLPGFENLDDAQNRLNELYNNYSHQQAYTILATTEPTITGYAVRLPQEAITYLTTDEQKYVTPVLKSNTHSLLKS